jgi:phosphoribosylformylglycinamidine cyclo-ligase
VIAPDVWTRPAIFSWLQAQGGIAEAEMLRTFNCGVGMVVCVAPKDAARTLEFLHAEGEVSWLLGRIEASTDPQPHIEIHS